MKKNILLITLIVLLGCFMFVSCDSEAAAPQTDELVKVSFVESTSKALTQNIPAFDVASRYWKYTAVKKDGSTLTTGATGTTHEVAQAQWVALDSNNSPKQGLSENNTPYQVINFSRGLWEFKLYGYSDAAATKLVYTGTSSTVALTKDYHQVSVNVSRDKTSGNGTLVIDKDITINNEPGEPYTNLSSAVVRTYEIKKYNSSTQQFEALNPAKTGTLGSEDVTIEDLAAGDYQITITYADSTYTYGSGSANFVIYSNVTTTITGSVSETITYAEFEATSNVINETASSKSFNSGTTSTTNTVEIKYESSTSTNTEDVVETVTAEVPLSAAQTLLSQVVAANDNIQADTTTTDTTITNEMVLTLAVSTESSTETSATYNIDMNYVLTNTVSTTGSNDVVTQVNGQVSTLDEYTTVMVKLPANLENVQFLHSNLTMKKTNSGTAIDSLTVLNAIGSTVTADETAENGVYPGYMWYDATTGSAYLRTRSFSPFSVTYDVPSYVASISTNFYTTLQAALNDAHDGDTVLLLKNITQDEGFLVNKENMDISLDLNGKTITVNNGANVSNRAFRIDNGTLRVSGGTIVAVGSGTTSSNGAGCYGAFRVESNGILYAENMTFQNARPWGLNVKVCGGEAYLTNVTINSSYGGGIEVTEADLGEHSKPGKATLTDCTFTQTGYYDHCSSALSVSGGSELIINSGTYSGEYGLYVFSSGGYITVKDGTFTGKSQNVFVAAIDLNTYPEYTGGFVIEGGTFTGSASITSPATMSITGGTFDHDPSDYVAEGYVAKVEQIESVDWWVVKAAVAQIGDVKYCSLADAVAAVPSDGSETTIKMINNTVIVGNAGVTIPTNKNVVLDLNGFTVKNAVNENTASQVIKNDGTLKIQDSSESKTGLITNAVQEGTQPGEWWSTPQYNYVTNVITNCGTLNVVSGKICQTASGSICYAIDNNSTSRSVTTTISGGLVCDEVGTAVRMFCNSVTNENNIVMTGGEIRTPGKAALWIQLPGSNAASMKKASLNISGGKISGGTYAFYDYSYGDGWDNVEYTVSGGVFEGKVESEKNEGNYKFIKGGTFDHDPSVYVATGYVANLTSDSTWIVEPEPAPEDAFASVTLNASGEIIYFKTDSDWSKLYENSPCTSGNYTLKLLKDYTYTAGSTAISLICFDGSNIVFDLNGKTLTVDTNSTEIIGAISKDDGFSNLTIKNGIIKNNYYYQGNKDLFHYLAASCSRTVEDSVTLIGFINNN